MIATVIELDHAHWTRLIMAVLTAAGAVFWLTRLKDTIDMAVKGTTVATALLMGLLIWISMAYIVLALDDDHSISTAVWLRPAWGAYMIVTCWRAWLYRRVVTGVLRLRSEVRRQHAESE